MAWKTAHTAYPLMATYLQTNLLSSCDNELHGYSIKPGF